MSYNIAVDGPAGAGKSTIARAVAKRMNLIYVDTGAMYRALALYVIRCGVDPADTKKVIETCGGADITIRYEGGEQVVVLNGENVNGFLRTEEVGGMASSISPIPQVRAKLVELQRRLAAGSDCIMDGRDIGTCVLPGAQTKIYLTADSIIISFISSRTKNQTSAVGISLAILFINVGLAAMGDSVIQRIQLIIDFGLANVTLIKEVFGGYKVFNVFGMIVSYPIMAVFVLGIFTVLSVFGIYRGQKYRTVV